MQQGLVLWTIAFAALLAGPAHAQTDLSQICDRAAVEAAAGSDVPVSVLKAISLTETGRDRGGETRPWPWTVNMEGKGVWFDTREAALAYVYEHYKRGARSFDVGCFQINYKWHHEHFASIEDMFDPTANAEYAALFLSDLHAETGDWEAAAGAFHSRTKKHADRYTAIFAGHRAKYIHEDGQPLTVPPPLQPLATAQAPVPVAVPKPRVNSYPLLQGGGGETGGSAMGSLFPLGSAGSLGFFAQGDAG